MLVLGLLLLASPSYAVHCATEPVDAYLAFGGTGTRPTEGGMYSFHETDVIEHLDGEEGLVRVHYSVSGPNVTLLDDADKDGLPDFAEEVADTAEAVLDFYVSEGFRLPVSEAEMGLGALGGSPAFDFYLVDFGGDADGMFSMDACTSEPNHCSGFMVMENDFAGYGYSNLGSAIRTLTSHELFHAVQMAYESGSPIWYTEGSAVWAERQFDPESEDFIWFASAYLEDAGRSIDEPPSGPVPAFAYATCLFWEFLSIRLGTDYNLDLQESLEWNGDLPDTLVAAIDGIAAEGSDIAQEWPVFADWNLATGRRAGKTESYDFASQITGIEPVATGSALQDDNRFYPLASSYYRLDFDGGALWFANLDDASGLVFTLHPVVGGSVNGPVGPAVAEWTPTAPGSQKLVEKLPSGTYWLVGSYPANADSSRKIAFCLGTETDVAPCLVADTGDTADSADSQPADDTSQPDDTATAGNDGCAGCATPGSRGTGLVLGLLALALGSRRRK
jgi:hypothetical protein